MTQPTHRYLQRVPDQSHTLGRRYMMDRESFFIYHYIVNLRAWCYLRTHPLSNPRTSIRSQITQHPPQSNPILIGRSHISQQPIRCRYSITNAVIVELQTDLTFHIVECANTLIASPASYMAGKSAPRRRRSHLIRHQWTLRGTIGGDAAGAFIPTVWVSRNASLAVMGNAILAFTPACKIPVG